MTPHGGGVGEGGPPEPARLFQRKEDKYELPEAVALSLKAEIARRLPLYEYRPGQPCTWISTVYFDNRSRDFYRRAETQHEDNLKIRVKDYYYVLRDGRTPAPEGGPVEKPSYLTSPTCYLELKRTLQDQVLKRRFCLPRSELYSLLSGQDLGSALLKVIPAEEVGALLDVYRQFQRFLTAEQLEVTSVVNYCRTVHQKDERELRITFDDQLSVFPPIPLGSAASGPLTPEALGKPLRLSENVILEVKYVGRYPEWLEEILERHPLVHFSKFTWGVRLLLGSTPPCDSSGEKVSETSRSVTSLRP